MRRYIKGTDTFFTMNAEWTMNNKTQYVNTTEYDFTRLKLFDPKVGRCRLPLSNSR